MGQGSVEVREDGLLALHLISFKAVCVNLYIMVVLVI